MHLLSLAPSSCHAGVITISFLHSKVCLCSRNSSLPPLDQTAWHSISVPQRIKSCMRGSSDPHCFHKGCSPENTVDRWAFGLSDLSLVRRLWLVLKVAACGAPLRGSSRTSLNIGERDRSVSGTVSMFAYMDGFQVIHIPSMNAYAICAVWFKKFLHCTATKCRSTRAHLREVRVEGSRSNLTAYAFLK